MDEDALLDQIIEQGELIESMGGTIKLQEETIEALEAEIATLRSRRQRAPSSPDVDALRSREWAVAARERSLAEREAALAEREAEEREQVKPEKQKVGAGEAVPESSEQVKSAALAFSFGVQCAKLLTAGRSVDEIAEKFEADRSTVVWALGVAGYPQPG